jgi:uncharacterized protein (TIGR00106 family)
MYTIAEFTIVPIGVGVSLSAYVAECEKMLQESGLTYELHANGTNVEGEWDEVNALIRACHERMHEMGVPRVYTVMKYATRVDKEQHMDDKIRSVEEKLRGV